MVLVKKYFEASLDALEVDAVALSKKTGCPCCIVQSGRWTLRTKILPGRIVVERRGYGDIVVINTYRLKKPKVRKMLVQEAPPSV